tara:strand:+ start:1650 stop:2096 length:447 start_codon:yes stop_codon:yes gene_type:complete
MQEIDIANFAQGIVDTEIAKGKPVQFAAPDAPDAPDVSDIKVSDDFAAQILTEGHWTKADVKVAPYKKPKVTEEKAYKNTLIANYKEKLTELNHLVDEMVELGIVSENFIGVGTGAIGVGAGGAVAAPKLSVFKRRKKERDARTRRTR